jgi:capsular polysaccharide export protein
MNKRMICVGFRRWKAANIKPLLSLEPYTVLFVNHAIAAKKLAPTADDCFLFWGRDAPFGLEALALQTKAHLIRMEDGFIRSVGLGSDLIKPLSIVLDDVGIYFDSTKPSRLEHILNDIVLSVDETSIINRVRELMVTQSITKYNIERHEKACWNTRGKTVVLVPGQVENDASIKYGCDTVKTNLGLLQAARKAEPEAFIVYKPHPDVLSGNRKGKIALAHALKYADLVELSLCITSCIAACDVVHTMTSLTGFDALIRNKQVVVYGQPFYAGWGLTTDINTQGLAFKRRLKKLSLDALMAGALLRYPIYWDWQLKGYTNCEAVIHQIIATRAELSAAGALDKLKVGYARRQIRKLKILSEAFFKKW